MGHESPLCNFSIRVVVMFDYKSHKQLLIFLSGRFTVSKSGKSRNIQICFLEAVVQQIKPLQWECLVE